MKLTSCIPEVNFFLGRIYLAMFGPMLLNVIFTQFDLCIIYILTDRMFFIFLADQQHIIRFGN